MSTLVIDASVVVKWFVPELDSDRARDWRDERHHLHAPAVFLEIEVANILWKKVRRGELARSDADLILTHVASLPLTRHSESPLIAPAFEIAAATDRTVYDSLYLTLAIHLDGQMLTADQRLCNALAATPWAAKVRHIADTP